MSPPTRICHLVHLLIRDVIPKRARSASRVNGSLHRNRHELPVDVNARGHFQIGVDAGKKSGLLVEFPACARGDGIEHVGNVEHVEVKSGRRDPQGRLLAPQRIHCSAN